MNDIQEAGKTSNTIIFTYGLLIVSTLCLFVPLIPVFVTGGLMLSFTWILSLALRFGKQEDNLVHNHMTYIARTITAWSTLTFLLAMIAGILISLKADNSAYDEMINNMMNGTSYSPQESVDVMMTYIKANMPMLIAAGVICLIPSATYITYRIAKGFSRALKGYRLAKPKAWL